MEFSVKGELLQGLPQKQLYDSKRDDLVDTFLGIYNPPRQSHEERDDLSRAGQLRPRLNRSSQTCQPKRAQDQIVLLVNSIKHLQN